MNDTFDEKLKQTLSEEDQAFLASLDDERGMYAQIGDTFRGSMRGWTAFAFVLSLAFFAGCIYTLVQLFGAPPVNEALLWLAGFNAAILSVSMIKLWFWLRMHQIALMRELKKIELRVAQLSQQ